MKKYVTTAASALKILLIPLFAVKLYFLAMKTINPENSALQWLNTPLLTYLCATISVIYVVSVLLVSYKRPQNDENQTGGDKSSVPYTPYTVPVLITYLSCTVLGVICSKLSLRFPEVDNSIPAMVIKSLSIALSAVETVCTLLYIPFAISDAAPSRASVPDTSDPETEILPDNDTDKSEHTETENQTEDTNQQ